MATRRFAWIVALGCLALVAAAAVPTLAVAEMPFFHGGSGGHGGGRGTITPGPYNLSFAESGLPSGTAWSVHVCGTSTPNGSSPTPQVTGDWDHCVGNYTTNASVTFSLSNGSYQYRIHPVQVGNLSYGADPSSGAVTLNGSGDAISVTFSVLVPYNVSFVESGLPDGTFWSVQLGGGYSWSPGNASNTTTIGFALVNGTYSYSVGTACNSTTVFVPSPASGTAVVNGSAVVVAVTFAPLVYYNLSFVESGLPTGTFWSVQLFGGSGGYGPGPYCGGSDWNGSANSTVNFTVPDGTYGFSVGNVSNNTTVYVPTPAAGNVTVNGTNVTVDIAFAPVQYYNVSFAETGLPSGTFWSVTLVGAADGGSPGPYCGQYEWNGSSNSTVNFTVPDGTYSFAIGNTSNNSTTFVPVPAAGNVTVNGSNVTVDVVFSPLALYNVTFVETGLPNGTFWSVVLVGNGSGGPEGPACGELFWNGSSNTTVNFTVPNGTYSFLVGNASNWTTEFVPTPANGTVTVDGASITIEVAFAPVVLYNVSFVETGLPNGTLWWVVVYSPSTGAQFNASFGNLTSFALANGSYNFSVWSVDSNCSTPIMPTPASGTITVSGASVLVRITF